MTFIIKCNFHFQLLHSRKEDVAVGWNRVECTFEIIQNNSTFILGLIADVLQSNNFSINGTEINASESLKII